MRCWIPTAISVVLALNAPGEAFAAKAKAKAKAKKPAATAPATKKPSKKDIAEARQRFMKAQKAYDLGQFDTALADYSEAYRLDPRPAFLFNIAQCQRLLGHYEQAAFHYRRFLDLSPDKPANASQVEALIADVDARREEQLRHKQQLAEAEAKAKAEEEARMRAEADARAKAENEGRLTGDQTAWQQPPLVITEPAPAPEPSGGILSKWWFWAGVGVVAAGAAGTAAYVVTRPAPA